MRGVGKFTECLRPGVKFTFLFIQFVAFVGVFFFKKLFTLSNNRTALSKIDYARITQIDRENNRLIVNVILSDFGVMSVHVT